MVRKKIGTLTFHVAHNYGAMLQAYALPIVLQDLGYDAEVIDYRFPYIYKWGKVENYKNLTKSNGVIKGTLKWGKRLLKGNYSPKRKINKFNFFRENVMSCSDVIYSKKEELKNMEYDAILFGSDQIWNENLTDGLATEFFGDFTCFSKTKKIAYAASCGKSCFSTNYKEIYCSLLKDFSALGVREQGLVNFLNENNLKAELVLDPTLLLLSSKWNEMVKKTKQYIKIPKEEYLLVYVFDEDDSIYTMIDKLASKYKLKVVMITYNKIKIRDSYCIIDECGPAEFVNLIANAKKIVTTSFHGTAFSIIYHKDFYCVPHPKYHERTDSLLYMLNLQDRNIKNINDVENKEPINWKNVERILNKKREQSIDFLKNSIEG